MRKNVFVTQKAQATNQTAPLEQLAPHLWRYILHADSAEVRTAMTSSADFRLELEGKEPKLGT